MIRRVRTGTRRGRAHARGHAARGLALALATLLLAAACSGDDSDDEAPATPTSALTGTATATVIATVTASATPTASPGATSTGIGAAGEGSGSSREDPAPPGVPLTVGGWSLRVVGANPDATTEILAADSFAEPPEEGRQFYTVELELTYIGAGSGDPYFDLTWGAVGPENLGYDEFTDGCGFVSGSLSDLNEIFSGGTTTGLICLAVRAADASDLRLYVEDFASFDGARSWFALPAPGQQVAVPSATPTVVATGVQSGAVGASRENPMPLGEEAIIGEWSVRVASTMPDATALLLAESELNDPPAPGSQFFLIGLELTYLGSDTGDAYFELSWGAVGPAAVAYTEFDSDCGFSPGDLASINTEATGGETVAGSICLEVSAEDAADLVLFVEDFSGLSKTRAWFALE